MRELKYKEYTITNTKLCPYNKKVYNLTFSFQSNVYIGGSVCLLRCPHNEYKNFKRQNEYRKNIVRCLGDEKFEPNKTYKLLLIEIYKFKDNI